MTAPVVITANDLITLALTDAGILGQGQTASAYDSANGLTRLNWELSQWDRLRWLVYRLEDLSVTSTGAQYYTIGPDSESPDISTGDAPRPDRLEAAFFRQLVQSTPNQLDYPLELLSSREDYNLIGLKQLQSFAYYCWYDSSWPLGKVYPWPIPQATIYSIHVSIKQYLGQIEVLADSIELPPEYYKALHLTMAEWYRMAYQLPEDMKLSREAKKARNVIRGANAQIARLQMPSELTRPGVYNPYSDQIR